MGDKEKSKGCWVVVASGGQQFIGRVVVEDAVINIALNEDKWDEKCAKLAKDLVHKRLIECAGWLTMQPIYEFYTPLAQNPGGQIVRQSITTPIGFTLGKNVPQDVQVNSVLFLDDLDDEDRKGYEDAISAARDLGQQSRAKRAGLHMPNSKS